MVIVKKIRSATLVEALVATVLVVIIFVIASLILNNVLLNTFSKNTHAVDCRINELEYEIQTGIIKLPYQETFNDWDISIAKITQPVTSAVEIAAVNKKNNREIIKKRIYAP